MTLLCFLVWEHFSYKLLSMHGEKTLGFHQKYLNLCSEDVKRSYGFETT